MESDTKAQHWERETEARVAEGNSWIRKNWSSFSERTRVALLETGGYEEGGRRANVRGDGSGPDHAATNIEDAVGTLCMGVVWPKSYTSNRSLWARYLDVQTASSTLLMQAGFRDEKILRLAVAALIDGKTEWLASQLRDMRKTANAWHIVRVFFRGIAMFFLPVSTAVGLVAAFNHDVITASVALYFVVYGLDRWRLAARGVDWIKSPVDAAWTEWNALRMGGIGTGAALCIRLDQMAARGVDIPPTVYDMAHLIRAKSEGC
jgi:hypothetical protein